MFLVSVLRNALFVLLPLSLISSSYLYLYPLFHLCVFPSPEQDGPSAYVNTLRQHFLPSRYNPTKVAPFRLLSLGDPQLEGDSSIPDPIAATFPNWSNFWKDALLLDGTRHNPRQRLRHSLHDLIDFCLDDIPKALQVYRKRLDHIGNDYYLGHIYRTLHWWTDPTHVTVLGDLVGSQWIDDDEFEHRGWRFWNRVFKHGEKVSDELASHPSSNFNHTIILGHNADRWKRRIINVAGNHDIGYAGDLSQDRMDRFMRVFGNPNYELRFQLPINLANVASNSNSSTILDEHNLDRDIPEIRIVVFNDMNLDTPVSSQDLQDETYAFLNEVITTSHDVDRQALFTLVLTHIPLYKGAGICVDGPFFDFFNGEFDNGVKEQNHLSLDASKGFLEGIYGLNANPEAPGQGLGRNGLILTGHDHEGCDTYHYINQSSDAEEKQWQATPWSAAQNEAIISQPGIPGLREITVRSMMGDFAGNAGLLSLWFDEAEWEWKFEFANCRLGKQHLWWVVHVLDLITLGVGIMYGALKGWEAWIATIKDRNDRKGTGNGLGKGRMKRIEKKTSVNALRTLPAVPSTSPKSLSKKKSKRSLNGNGYVNGSISGTSSRS
ncbi:hypothetical protein B7494_g4773 [Chlorociboria aeruginascens]|nr:hypothetical protein B7494_g4773 [Chlorociboria aeruginascens]